MENKQFKGKGIKHEASQEAIVIVQVKDGDDTAHGMCNKAGDSGWAQNIC